MGTLRTRWFSLVGLLGQEERKELTQNLKMMIDKEATDLSITLYKM
jgi:hypothetical protein